VGLAYRPLEQQAASVIAVAAGAYARQTENQRTGNRVRAVDALVWAGGQRATAAVACAYDTSHPLGVCAYFAFNGYKLAGLQAGEQVTGPGPTDEDQRKARVAQHVQGRNRHTGVANPVGYPDENRFEHE